MNFEKMIKKSKSRGIKMEVNNKFKSYLDRIFSTVVETEESINLKDEILGDMLEKYNDLVEGGMDGERAYAKVITSFGDLDEIISELERREKSQKDMDEDSYKKNILPLYNFSEAYKDIYVEGDVFTLDIKPNEDEVTRVEIIANEDFLDLYEGKIMVVDDCLMVKLKRPENKLLRFSFPTSSNKIVVRVAKRLIKNTLGKVKLKSVSGSIYISEMTASKFDLNSISGSIGCDHLVGDKLSLDTVSGRIETEEVGAKDIKINSVSGSLKAYKTLGEDIYFNAVSGSIEIENIKGRTLKLNTVSGGIKGYGGNLYKVKANTVSGGIKFNGFVEDTLDFNTMSGGIKCDLETKSSFNKLDCKTMSGGIHVRVPEELSRPYNFNKSFMSKKVIAGPNGEINLKSSTGSIRLND